MGVNTSELIDSIITLDRENWRVIVEMLIEHGGDSWMNELKFSIDELDRTQGVEMHDTKLSIEKTIEKLDRAFEDSKRYRYIPEEIRVFLESSGETTLLLGQRLIESVHSRDRVIMIREILKNNKFESDNTICKNCKLMELVNAVTYMVNTDI